MILMGKLLLLQGFGVLSGDTQVLYQLLYFPHCEQGLNLHKESSVDLQASGSTLYSKV